MEKNLWEEIGNTCLNRATNLLKLETVPSAETAETVKNLVETAIAIDMLNLHWAEQNRYGAAVFAGRPSSRTAKGN